MAAFYPTASAALPDLHRTPPSGDRRIIGRPSHTARPMRNNSPMSNRLTGCGTALVTPFRADLSVDEEALRRLIRRQIEQGIDFLVPCGTTGESPTLTRSEHLRVVEIAVEEANGQVPVVGGAGGYDTADVATLAKEIQRIGADGVLSVTPYYNKPTQEGLYRHYELIASKIDLPIILYSVQGRTAVNIEPATVERLAKIPNIVAVKEASGNIQQMANILNRVPDDFIVLSGDDAITLPLMAMGGRGVISVVSNQIPREMSELARLANQGDFEGARRIHRRYLPLMEVNFVESNPGPVKAAMSMMGLLEPHFRLPMVMPQQASLDRIRQVLDQVELLEGRTAGVR
jgi:4-hydroxy-tetrahydrodipicolinate synthase